MTTLTLSKADDTLVKVDFKIGWRYYNIIRKKAMEQKFSKTGFLLSLSIAFFIVIFGAYLLSFIHISINNAKNQKQNIVIPKNNQVLIYDYLC